MSIVDVLCIIFACTAANHLGLVQAIEIVTCRTLYVVNCPKCFVFWASLLYMVWCVGFSDIPLAFAVSFLSAWSAVWLDLIMGIIDQQYLRIYDKVFATKDSADADSLSSSDTVSDVSVQS